MATVLTNVGRSIISNRMLGATPTQAEPKYVNWGTGAGTAAVADTALFTEVAAARVTGTGTVVTTTVTGDTHQVVATLTAAVAETVTNVGVFDASTAGNLYVHGDFAGQALGVGDQITFTIQIQHT